MYPDIFPLTASAGFVIPRARVQIIKNVLHGKKSADYYPLKVCKIGSLAVIPMAVRHAASPRWLPVNFSTRFVFPPLFVIPLFLVGVGSVMRRLAPDTRFSIPDSPMLVVRGTAALHDAASDCLDVLVRGAVLTIRFC